MTNLIIVHRTNQDSFEQNNFSGSEDLSTLIWETCRRRLYFFDENSFSKYVKKNDDEIYTHLDAEEFLIEVLCGLKSPLVGETEVFGQFKKWWQNLTNAEFKNKFEKRIQLIYATVKKIRDENLCGLGSQSYGSLLRKKILENSSSAAQIDFVGAGLLVQEIQPWIQKKWTYRIRCREPLKLKGSTLEAQAAEIMSLKDLRSLAPIVVVAAPLEHEILHQWLQKRLVEPNVAVYDFRSNSSSYSPPAEVKTYFRLNDFTNEVDSQKKQISEKIRLAGEKISHWKQAEVGRTQIRPFGWDDL